MAWLAAAAPYISAASTVFAVGSQIQQGKRAKSIAEMQAREKEKAANEAAAESQRDAQTERKKAKYVASRARAVAGASGAGVTDPTTTNLLTDIESQGEYNAYSAIFSGTSMEDSLRAGASIDRNRGSAVRSASYANSASTAISGGSSWFDKYGEDFKSQYAVGIP